MPIIINISGNSSEDDGRFAPPSDGYHAAVLADIIPLGVRKGGMYGDKDESVLVFLTDEKNPVTGELKDQLFWASNSLFRNKTTGKESKLRGVVRALRGGVELTDEEEKQPYDIEQHIGSEVKLLTEQYEAKNGKLRSKVLSIKKADPGKGVAIPASYVRDKDKAVGDRLGPKLGAVPVAPKPATGGRAAAAAVLAPARAAQYNGQGVDVTDAIPF